MQSMRVNHPLLLLKLFVILSLTSIVALAIAIVDNRDAAQLVGLSMITLIILVTPLFRRKDYHPFEPLTLVLLLYLFGAPYKLLYVSWIQDSNAYIAERLLLWKPIGALVPGTAITGIGIAFLCIGYGLGSRFTFLQRLYMPSVGDWRHKRVEIIAGAIAMVALIFLLTFIVVAGVNWNSLSEKRFADQAETGGNRIFMVKYYLYRGASLSKFAVYLSYVCMVVARKRYTSLLGAIFLLSMVQSIALFAIMNSRAGIALIVVDLLALVYFLRGRLSTTTLVASGAAVLLLIVGVLAGRSIHQSPVAHLLEKTLAGRDMMDITKTCHIINAVPYEIDYRYGETLFGWVAAPIPRSVWPDKPMWAERGVYLFEHVYGHKEGITGIPPGLIAELYWNFSIYGVVVGMLLFGFICRVLWASFQKTPKTPTSILIYVILITRFTLFALGNDLGTGIVKTGLDLVPLMLVIYLVGLKTSKAKSLPTTLRSSRPGLANV